MNKKSMSVGILFLMLSMGIIGVSAYVYQSATQTVTQTIKEIATLALNNAALGNINEGQTLTYTKTEIPALGSIVSVTTTTANVNLHFSSDLASQSTRYSTYSIAVKLLTKPGGSTLTVGNTYATMSIGSPTPSGFALDVAGTYVFDFEITTTTTSVNSDTATTVTITVTAEST
jgi:hypothetical protein